MKEMFHKFTRLLKSIKAKIAIAVLLICILVGIFFDYKFIFPILIVGFMFYLMKQAEKEKEEIEKKFDEEDFEVYRIVEIRKLEKRIEVIKEHLEKTEDLEAKLKLLELEEELAELKKYDQK